MNNRNIVFRYFSDEVNTFGVSVVSCGAVIPRFALTCCRRWSVGRPGSLAFSALVVTSAASDFDHIGVQIRILCYLFLS